MNGIHVLILGRWFVVRGNQGIVDIKLAGTKQQWHPLHWSPNFEPGTGAIAASREALNKAVLSAQGRCRLAMTLATTDARDEYRRRLELQCDAQ